MCCSFVKVTPLCASVTQVVAQVATPSHALRSEEDKQREAAAFGGNSVRYVAAVRLSDSTTVVEHTSFDLSAAHACLSLAAARRQHRRKVVTALRNRRVRAALWTIGSVTYRDPSFKQFVVHMFTHPLRRVSTVSRIAMLAGKPVMEAVGPDAGGCDALVFVAVVLAGYPTSVIHCLDHGLLPGAPLCVPLYVCLCLVYLLSVFICRCLYVVMRVCVRACVYVAH